MGAMKMQRENRCLDFNWSSGVSRQVFGLKKEGCLFMPVISSLQLPEGKWANDVTCPWPALFGPSQPCQRQFCRVTMCKHSGHYTSCIHVTVRPSSSTETRVLYHPCHSSHNNLGRTSYQSSIRPCCASKRVSGKKRGIKTLRVVKTRHPININALEICITEPTQPSPSLPSSPSLMTESLITGS